jgi:hypothetical protein
MCYTGICKHENYMGDCTVGEAKRKEYCYLADDYEEETPDEEDEDE